MLSNPGLVLDVIRKAADAVPKSLKIVNLHLRVCIPMKSRTSPRRRVLSWSGKEREA